MKNKKGYRIVYSKTIPISELRNFKPPVSGKFIVGYLPGDFLNSCITIQKLVKIPRIFCNIKR